MRIAIAGASVSFGDREVFRDLTMNLPASRVSAIVGPSGSGKSTLLAAIAGYQPLNSGAILMWEGVFSTPPDPTYVAWVPQGINALGARSSLDNVVIAALAAGRSLQEAREIGSTCLLQVGLDALADQEARTLSGGELQRLSIARALASEKPIILADEPTANLDAANTARVATLLANLSGTATIIVATHDQRLLVGVDLVVELGSQR